MDLGRTRSRLELWPISGAGHQGLGRSQAHKSRQILLRDVNVLTSGESCLDFSLLVLALVLVLAACGNPDATSTTTAASPTSTSEQSTTTLTTAGTTTPAPAATTTTAAALPLIKVEDGAKTSGLDIISVRVGETVRFEVEADIADEVHVHGYDLSFDTIPDEAILVEFVADATGIFEVEIEGLGLPIVDIEVTP